jgi:glycosyltransferase involved in cell wall biosynthesis
MPSRVLRHCMVVDNHYPDIRVEREANALIERGHRVDIICLRTPGTSRVERIGRLTIYRLPVSRRRGASAVTQLWEYTAFLAWATAMVTLRHLKARYDVVQVHNVPDFLVFSAGFAKATGAAVLLDLHDLMPEFFASRFGGDLRGPLARLVLLQERAAIGFADAVVTVTDLWRDALVARGVPAHKAHVVMNVPDERRFPIREPLTRSDGPVTVVYHGTLTRRYGLDILLTAFADARARHPMRLLIHGRGEFADDARRLANDLGLGDAVTFSNALLTTDELAALIGQGDIGVVPNRNDILTDGILPTKLMEYAALGIPGIVSRSTAVASYFTDDMVRFVEPGNSDDLADALVELAAHPEERAALARNAQRFSREHRWSDQAAAYVDLVERLADARSTKSGNGRETTT